MRNTSIGLEAVGFMTRMAIIVIVFVVAAWISVVLLLAWALFHILTTVTVRSPPDAAPPAVPSVPASVAALTPPTPRSPMPVQAPTQDPVQTTNWFAVGSAVLAASSILPMLLSEQFKIGNSFGGWMIPFAVVAVVTGVLALKRPGNDKSTLYGTKFALWIGVIGVVIGASSSFMNAPDGIEVRRFEPTGTATTIEEMWDTAGCRPDTTRIVESVPGIVSTGRDVTRIGICTVDEDAPAGSVAFLQFEDPESLAEALTEANVTGEPDYVHDVTALVDGQILILTTDSGSSSDLRNLGIAEFYVY